MQVDPINDIVYHICMISMESNAVLKSYPRGYGRQNETKSITADAYGVEGCFLTFKMWQLTCMKTSNELWATFMRKCR